MGGTSSTPSRPNTTGRRAEQAASGAGICSPAPENSSTPSAASENFLDTLAAGEPAYAAVRALKAPSSDDVQGRLPADTALVEYHRRRGQRVDFRNPRGRHHAKTVAIRSIDLTAKVELLGDLDPSRRGR